MLFPPSIPIDYVVASMQTAAAGTEGHLLRLIRGLDRRRFTPRLIVMQKSAWLERFQDADVPVEVLGFRSFSRPGDWRCLLNLAHHFRRRQTQIVELHYADAHFAGAIAARRAGVPVVISCRRDLGHQYTWRSLLMVRMANPWVNRFLANSHQVAATLAPRERIAPDRFDVIHNGVDLPAFDAQCGEPPAERFLAATRGKRVVTLLANLRPVKNVSGFLVAAKLIADRVPNVQCVVLGSGELAEPLQRQAHQMGIADRVTWLGSVRNPAAYLVRSEVGCLTSNAEGFSNAIVEYMAAGLPVVATRVGGAEEAIVEHTTGYLVDQGDMQSLAMRVVDLLNSEPLRVTMGTAGRLRVEGGFTQQRQLDRYHDYYEQLWSVYHGRLRRSAESWGASPNDSVGESGVATHSRVNRSA